MMGYKFAAAFLSLSGVALAQSTSITSLFLLADEGKFVGSVIQAGPSAATLQIACPSGTPSDECGLDGPLVLTAFPSGVEATMTMSDYTVTETCTVLASDSAVCHVTMSTASMTGPTVTDATFTGSSVSEGWVPVTITAGLEKLAAATGAAGSVTGSAASSSGASAASTGVSGTGSASHATKTPSGTSATASPASTGAASSNIARGVSVAGAMAVAMVMAL